MPKEDLTKIVCTREVLLVCVGTVKDRLNKLVESTFVETAVEYGDIQLSACY
jgi:hypothetical protein